MMNRFVLLAFVVHSLSAATAIGDEYLLRLDTIGYVDRPASEEEPNETVLRSIEIVARPHSAFHGKVNIGTQSLTLAGIFCPADDGGFDVHIRYVYSVDTGTTAPAEDGTRQPLPDTTTVETEVTISVGGSVTIGGFDTTKEAPGKPTQKSQIRYVLILAEYEPAES